MDTYGRNIIIEDKLSEGKFSNIYKIKYNNQDCILKEENENLIKLKNEINIYL